MRSVLNLIVSCQLFNLFVVSGQFLIVIGQF